MNAAQRRDWRAYVFGCADLTPGQRLVLLALEGYADWPQGTNARPGVEGLAALCGCGHRVVEYALARGRALNLIKRTSRANPKRGLAAVYKLLPAPVSTRTGIRVEDTHNPHDGADRNGFNPHETQFQPARDDVSTRTSVQPTNPLIPIHNTYEVHTQARNSAGTRLPTDWEPPTAAMDALQTKFPQLDLTEALEEFRDYWCAIPGARGRKTDWEATFRNRLRDLEKRRKETEQRQSRYAGTNRPRRSTTDQRVADIQALKRQPINIPELES